VIGYGFLYKSDHQTPATVQLELYGDELVIRDNQGTEALPLADLRKISDDGMQLQLGRRRRRNWRLSVSGELATQLRSAIGGRFRWLKWSAARTWHALAFIVVLLIVELVKIPPEWLAPVLPAAIEQRLVAQDLRSFYGSYCTSPKGERALRDLVRHFDRGIADTVKIEVIRSPEFIVTALPGHRLLISNAFLTALNPDELAALLAHQVAHLQRHDEVRAALRANGTLGALIGTISGTRRPDYVLEFTDDEEWSADARAIQMLRLAQTSTLPAAGLFERMQRERDANRSFGKEQYYLHWGLGSVRPERWRDAQDQSERLQARPSLDQEQADALFKYCWRRQGAPAMRARASQK
jgi:hypothetical protein